jgi:hypothetical protein
MVITLLLLLLSRPDHWCETQLHFHAEISMVIYAEGS